MKFLPFESHGRLFCFEIHWACVLFVAFFLHTLFLLKGEAGSAPDSSYPLPYYDNDKGLGNRPTFTWNQSQLLPEWLSLAVQHRTRYETLDNAFRAGGLGSDQVLAHRTLAQATLHLSTNFKVQLELQDSRAELNDSGSVVNTTIVNTVELLEANLQWKADNVFKEGSRVLLRAGRITMDIGKRRLVARNRFRNTKNAFTGVDGIWRAPTGETVRMLFTLPVNRRPASVDGLLDNDTQFDEERFDRILWGVFAATPKLPGEHHGEIYIFGYHEKDGVSQTTSNRQLYTPGLRFFKPPRRGHWDYEWESMFQFGTSRATTFPSDTRDLNHLAHFHHVETGYSFATAWAPRLVVAFDYASGDGNPNDGRNGRFDSLFGANTFDYGPTSIHRAFVRSNITGPGLKFSIKPHPLFKAYAHYRAFWLASRTDVWAGNSGLRDPDGTSGSFLGHLLYLMGSWQATPNFRMEGGVAHRLDGDFQKSVPGGPRQGNSTYAYIGATVSF